MTGWLLIAVVQALILYDLFAVRRWGYTGTISYVVLAASRKYPAIPLALGVVLGHIFWAQ